MIQAKPAEAYGLGDLEAAALVDSMSKYRHPHAGFLEGDNPMQPQATFLCQVFEGRCRMLASQGCDGAPVRCSSEHLNVWAELHPVCSCEQDRQTMASTPARNEASIFYFNYGMHVMHLFPVCQFVNIRKWLHALQARACNG
eukprot:365001-Chlamydomonas_euryale.AAC.9